MSVPKAEVVNALIEPVAAALRSCAGLETVASDAHLASALPPPPAVAVRIEVHGALSGRVTWSFDLPLARRVAEGMLGAAPHAPAMIADAAAELANIIAGNAAGLLEAAGHAVELRPPSTLTVDRPADLAEKALAFTFATREGTVSMILELHAA